MLTCTLGAIVWAKVLIPSLTCILGSTSWAYSVAKVPSDPVIPRFPGNTWKCNLFVSDIIYQSGAR
jgi:hypothetical protein